MEDDIALIQRLPGVPRLLSACLAASGMGIVAVARVTPEAWVACAVLDRMGFGLAAGGALPVETTLCGVVRDTREPIVIEHASAEALWCGHPTPRRYGYESHVSVPIVLPDGEVFGTLVAIDPRPLPVRAPDTVATFTLLAELLGLQIEAERRAERQAAALAAARAEGEARERHLAVLGHDLRNPLAAIAAAARLLGREGLPARARGLLDVVEGSARRMEGLVAETLDFARGRLAGGIPVALEEGVALGPLVAQVVAELSHVHPGRAILAELGALPPLRADPRRLGQLLSNLLGNALDHGAAEAPVRVGAAAGDGACVLWVENGGAPIPEALLTDLFEPFRRGPDGAGLGLGLYIAAEIARAHGGSLAASSGAEGTRMALTLPL